MTLRRENEAECRMEDGMRGRKQRQEGREFLSGMEKEYCVEWMNGMQKQNQIMESR